MRLSYRMSRFATGITVSLEEVLSIKAFALFFSNVASGSMSCGRIRDLRGGICRSDGGSMEAGFQ